MDDGCILTTGRIRDGQPHGQYITTPPSDRRDSMYMGGRVAHEHAGGSVHCVWGAMLKFQHTTCEINTVGGQVDQDCNIPLPQVGTVIRCKRGGVSFCS